MRNTALATEMFEVLTLQKIKVKQKHKNNNKKHITLVKHKLNIHKLHIHNTTIPETAITSHIKMSQIHFLCRKQFTIQI